MENLRVLIAGGRTFSEYSIFDLFVTDILNKYDYDNIEIVSGHCDGVDKMGEDYALANNINVKVFPAEWKKYGKSAGPIRNKQMVDYISENTCKGILIAFWDGKSRGTKNTIELCKKQGVPIYVFYYETEDVNSNLYEGIKLNSSGEFEFDFISDSEDDIVSFNRRFIHSSKYKKLPKYYGYKFNATASPSNKSAFLHYIKDEKALNTPNMQKLIYNCIDDFFTECEIKHFDYILKTPSKSRLVSDMCETIVNEFDDATIVDLTKVPTSEMDFDWDLLRSKLPSNYGEEGFAKIKSFLSNMLKNKSQEYFSVSKNVPPKYRQYLKPITTFGENTVDLTNAKNILIVDDTFTTGYTFYSTIKLLRDSKFEGNIYILSLMNNN